MVTLNFGGEKYTTTVDTLTREKDTFFTALFSKQWKLERGPDDKSIFIDRNGKIFAYILEYFRLHQLVFHVDKGFPDGTFLQPEQEVKLNEFYGEIDQRWELIYEASRDGFDANAFHSRCDNKGPTMTIIQSNNNYLFGGYTTIPWSSDGTYKSDATAFLFTLANPHNISPTKYLINLGNVENAVEHTSICGPTFGSGNDIYVANASNSSNSYYTGFPNGYIDTTGKSNNTFTGAYYFTTSDIEVFKLAEIPPLPIPDIFWLKQLFIFLFGFFFHLTDCESYSLI
jgi:hypothetical protein